MTRLGQWGGVYVVGGDVFLFQIHISSLCLIFRRRREREKERNMGEMERARRRREDDEDEYERPVRSKWFPAVLYRLCNILHL